MIVLWGLKSTRLVTLGFGGAAAPVATTPGCVHARDAALYQTTSSDAARYAAAAAAMARYLCTVTDEAC